MAVGSCRECWAGCPWGHTRPGVSTSQRDLASTQASWSAASWSSLLHPCPSAGSLQAPEGG